MSELCASCSAIQDCFPESCAGLIVGDLTPSEEAILKSGRTCAIATTNQPLIYSTRSDVMSLICFAAVATAKAEMPSKKKFNYTIIFWVVTSYIVSSMVYLIGEWWWTLFIWLAVWAVAITLTVLYNKGKLKNIKLPKISFKKRS